MSALVPLPLSPHAAVVLIPSYVGSLLRYRLLKDTLRSIASSEKGVDLTVLLSFQCCVREGDGEQGEEEEAEKRDDQLVDDPHTDLTYLDSTPLNRTVSHKRLEEIFQAARQVDVNEKVREEVKEKKGNKMIKLLCFEHPSVDEGAVLYGSVKPMSQFEHIRFLAQFVGENNIVFFSDDDDLSLPTRYSRVVSLFANKQNRDLQLVFHQIVRFYSTLLYHSAKQLLLFAEKEKEERDQEKKEEKFPEYFQFVIRGSMLQTLLNAVPVLRGFHMQDVRFCEALYLLMQDNRTQAIQCNEPLLVFRKAAHKRYWSSSMSSSSQSSSC